MASSPSKVHFSHYIVGTFNPHITIVNAKMAKLPRSRGKALRCWTKGLNVIMEKIPGNCNLDKLHIIMLFEADFNYNNKCMGWAVMLSAE